MTPYYDRDGITIYHGDCRDVLPTLGRECVDLLVTDPPSEVVWRGGKQAKRFAVMAGNDAGGVWLEGVEAAVRVLRTHRHLYVFGPFDLSPLPICSPVELIWDKGQFNAGNHTIPWAPQHERIQFAVRVSPGAKLSGGAGRLTARLRRGSVLRYPRLNAGAVTRHPTEKPVGLLRELIESSSCIGETVIDPFVGVGSTLVAAMIEGRRAIGIEIDEHYCEIAAKRLAQSAMVLPDAG